MGVTVIIRFPVSDVAKAVEGMRAHASLLEKITESTKDSGRFTTESSLVTASASHSRMRTAEQFQSFLEGSSDVRQVISELSVARPSGVCVQLGQHAWHLLMGCRAGLGAVAGCTTTLGREFRKATTASRMATNEHAGHCIGTCVGNALNSA